jgi:hypothetical protein
MLQSMQKNYSWEAASCSSPQEITRMFMEPVDSLPCSKDPATALTLSQINPVHTTPNYFSKIHLVLSFHLRLSFSGGLFLSSIPTKILYALLWHTC